MKKKISTINKYNQTQMYIVNFLINACCYINNYFKKNDTNKIEIIDTSIDKDTVVMYADDVHTYIKTLLEHIHVLKSDSYDHVHNYYKHIDDVKDININYTYNGKNYSMLITDIKHIKKSNDALFLITPMITEIKLISDIVSIPINIDILQGPDLNFNKNIKGISKDIKNILIHHVEDINIYNKLYVKTIINEHYIDLVDELTIDDVIKTISF